MRILSLTEHEAVSLGENPKELKELFLSCLEGQGRASSALSEQRLMGMSYDFPDATFFMSYYVGAEWIDRQKGLAMVVRPKIKGLDFQTMLMKCFESPVACKNLDELLYIRTEAEPIEISTQDFQIEPLLLVYFLNMIQKIVRKGLRHDYYFVEERLKGKMKGKLLFSKYIHHGIATNRKDVVDCRYQEYGVNCLDNRILKKALLLCKEMMERNREGLGLHTSQLDHMYRNAIVAFQHVDEDVSLQELRTVHVPAMYKEYRQILPLASMIIRKQGYCVGDSTIESVQKFPPFIINMPILFERYVYALLAERYGDKNIDYQVATYGNIVDFCKYDEQLILDTKYILAWNEGVDHENVRQLSGYARNRKLRSKLAVTDDNQVLPCVIIYPGKTGVTSFMDFSDSLYTDSRLDEIKPYVRFKKMGISLPVLNTH